MKKNLFFLLTAFLIVFPFGSPAHADDAQGESGHSPPAIHEKADKQSDETTPEEIEKLGLLSEAGDKDASYQLFQIFLHGRSVKKNKQMAGEYLKLAANQGHPIAQYELGNLYDRVKKDKKRALLWYREAAARGNAPAQYNLGVSYANGDGVEQDFGAALQWYEKAAVQGYVPAQYNMGVAYEMGEGAPKDSKTAVTWFRRAAMRGYGLAQFNLGAIYYNAGQVEKDIVAAHAWFKLSLEYGAQSAEQYARQGMRGIEPMLTQAQKKEAETLYRTLHEEIEKKRK